MATAVTQEAVRPPAGYHPDGLAAWVDDDLDPFFTPLGERPWVADPAAEPTPAEMRAVYEGHRELNRVVREGKGYRWAPPIRNHGGTLGQVRPTSPDRVIVDLSDSIHFKAWAHQERRRWAQRQMRAAEQTRQMEAKRPRCPICGTTNISAPVFRPWSKGKGLCAPCVEAVNQEGARRHYEAHQAAIHAWLETLNS